jgi:CheY-like chemotaxis protein
MNSTEEQIIICVDDDPFILQILSHQLKKRFSYDWLEVETYTNPDEALLSVVELLEEGGLIPLVVVDYRMPQMNGTELVRKLKSAGLQSRFLMLSGQANSEDVDQLFQEGLLDAFHEKPWSEEDFLVRICELVPELAG